MTHSFGRLTLVNCVICVFVLCPGTKAEDTGSSAVRPGKDRIPIDISAERKNGCPFSLSLYFFQLYKNFLSTNFSL